MYTLIPDKKSEAVAAPAVATKKKNKVGIAIIALWVVAAVVVLGYVIQPLLAPIAPAASSNPSTEIRTRNALAAQVTLAAKSWNDGNVHVWHTLVETEATFTDVRDGTHCERLDNKTHRLIGPPPPIYYYKVNCNGVVGYVEIDQVR